MRNAHLLQRLQANIDVAMENVRKETFGKIEETVFVRENRKYNSKNI